MNRRRLMLWLVGLIGLAALGLVAANVADYVRFHRAVARVERLTLSEISSLADYCGTVKEFIRFERKQTPPAFEPLKPIRGTLCPGSCDALLYEAGEIYLWFTLSTSPSNQRINYFTNSTGPQKSTMRWNRNPAFLQTVSPSARLVTVAQWELHRGRSWIVLPDRICVVDRSFYVAVRIPCGPAHQSMTKAAV